MENQQESARCLVRPVIFDGVHYRVDGQIVSTGMTIRKATAWTEGKVEFVDSQLCLISETGDPLPIEADDIVRIVSEAELYQRENAIANQQLG